MYLLPKAKAGKYKIRAKYYAKNDNRASTRTRVFMTLYRDWGTAKEKEIHKAITLETGKEMHDLATIKISRWK